MFRFAMVAGRSATVRAHGLLGRFARRVRGGRPLGRQEGQTTAEYALVLLAAAAVAFVLIAWAQSSGKLPAFFDSIIDNVTSGF
jgi:Flp pilus assembly pilin Flp